MNKYTTQYAAEQLIWAIIDWENIVNHYGENRCWTEPAKGATAEHAFLIQELLRGFRADVDRDEFWLPTFEDSWIKHETNAAQIAYGRKMVEGLSPGWGRIHLNKHNIKIDDGEINMHEVFQAACDSALVRHFVMDSLRFATKILAPLTPIGANPESTYTTVSIAIYNDRQEFEQQVRSYLLKELQPLIQLLCAQAETWVTSVCEKLPSFQEIRRKYENEALEDY